MTGALIILAVTIAIGFLLWAWEKARGDRPLHHHSPRPNADNGENTDNEKLKTKNSQLKTKNTLCCGLHAICEKTGQVNDPPVYYDDEELDRFAGREAEDYADDEIEEFRDILLTLMPSDAPGWTISLEKRRIKLPDALKPELDLLLSEA